MIQISIDKQRVYITWIPTILQKIAHFYIQNVRRKTRQTSRL